MLSARPENVSAYELYSLHERSTSLNCYNTDIKLREFSESGGYGLRVLKNGRLGFSYCEKETTIHDAMKVALSLSKFSPKTCFSFAGSSRPKSLVLRNKKLADMEIKELGGILGQVRDAARKGVDRCKVLLNCQETLVHIENSEGLSVSCNKTALSVFAESTAGDGYGFYLDSSCAQLKNPEQIGERASQMAREMKKPARLQNGEYTVVLAPEALASLLEILLPSFSGDWKRKGITRLAYKRGRKVFSEKISLWDDATDMRSSAAMPFDGEGVPSEKRMLVTDGVLEQFLYDRESAALAKVRYDGFCSRGGYSVAPSVGSSTLVFKTGEYDNFGDELRDFILVHSMHGSHTSNPTTGHFGLEVNAAFRIKNGKKTPVRGFILTGNIFSLFRNVLGLEKKAHAYEGLIAPRIAFDDVRVVG